MENGCNEKQIFTFENMLNAALKFVKHYCNCLETTADKYLFQIIVFIFQQKRGFLGKGFSFLI
jgi:hypothetical protein